MCGLLSSYTCYMFVTQNSHLKQKEPNINPLYLYFKHKSSAVMCILTLAHINIQCHNIKLDYSLFYKRGAGPTTCPICCSDSRTPPGDHPETDGPLVQTNRLHHNQAQSDTSEGRVHLTICAHVY